MRICKTCNIEKKITEFQFNGISVKTGKEWYRWRCKKCEQRRFNPPTGKPNTGRFTKGNIAWNKSTKGIMKANSGSFKKGCISIKKIGNGGRGSINDKEWKRLVFEKDGYMCQECFSNNNLHAHHVKNWNDYPELRFEISNGLTLCEKCHMTFHGKKDGFQKNNPGPWLGKKMTLEQRKKLSDVHIGIKPSDETRAKLKTRTPARLGKKHTEETKQKISESKKGTLLSEEHKEKLRGRVPWNKGLRKEIK